MATRFVSRTKSAKVVVLAAVVALSLGMNVTPAAGAPPNDNYPGADITSFPASLTGTTEGATGAQHEDYAAFDGWGTPDEWTTVWYSFTPTISQWTTIDTCGSELDTVTAVLSVARNDDSELCGDDDSGSSVTLNTQAGTTYRIAVDGYDYDEGPFQLRIRPDTDGPMTQLNGAFGSNGHGLGAFLYDTDATFDFQRNEQGGYVGPWEGNFECALDAATFAPCTRPVTYHGIPPGEHVFRVRAIDEAGNPDPTPAEVRWTIYAPPPPPTPPISAAPSFRGPVIVPIDSAPRLSVTVARQRLRAALAHGVALGLRMSEPGRACTTITLGLGAARRVGLRPTKAETRQTNVVLGSRCDRFTAPGTRTVTVRFTARAKRALTKLVRARTTLVVVARFVATDAAGHQRTLTRQVRLAQ